jgi:hypothetical protein
LIAAHDRQNERLVLICHRALRHHRRRQAENHRRQQYAKKEGRDDDASIAQILQHFFPEDSPDGSHHATSP